MVNINLAWDSTDVDASANATGQVASKRKKSVGGVWEITGFTPANDMTPAQNVAVASILENTVYEFKIEAICSGSLMPNLNGIVEGIKFVCVAPVVTKTHNSVTTTVDLSNTDITKMRVRLRKQSDNTLVQTMTVNRTINTAQAVIPALPSTAYYVTIEFFAVVNGIEVVSSSADYLSNVCGGNTAGYQATTNAAPTSNAVNGGVGASEISACANSTTYYVAAPATNIAPGTTVFVDAGMTTPLVGSDFIKSGTGQIYAINSGTGVVGALSVTTCGGNIVINNTLVAGGSITNINPAFFAINVGAIPVGPAESASGLHGGYTGVITIDIATSVTAYLRVVGGTFNACIDVSAGGTFATPSGILLPGQNLVVTLNNTPC